MWESLRSGSFAVTKSSIPFVSIGPDHACEQVNRWLKEDKGIIGITTNENCRQKFFLAAPELSKIAEDFKKQYNLDTPIEHHHALNSAAITREHSKVQKLKDCIASFCNPFKTECQDVLINIISHAEVDKRAVDEIITTPEKGQSLYETFVTERFHKDTSLWAPMKRARLKRYNYNPPANTSSVQTDLKDTKCLFGRLMVIAKSSRDVNQAEAIGMHEFTVNPRAFFSPDGTVLL